MSGRRRRVPLASRAVLGLSVIALAAATLLAARGGIEPIVTTLAAGFGSAFDRLTATPLPTPTDTLPTRSPLISSPAQPYTRSSSVDLDITLPADVAGDPGAKIRIYLALEGLEAAPVLDVPVGTTSRLIVPFELTVGRNDITATAFVNGLESEPSPIVTWILDQEPPKLKITSPRDGGTVGSRNVTISGATQAGSTIIARNRANGTSTSTMAGGDGAFELRLPLVAGANEIAFTVTDPAGNRAEDTMTIKQGSAEMRARLFASLYRISVSNHPSSLQLTVLVTDPDGEPLANAIAFFTLQIPGLAPISNSVVTNADGRAIFTTPLIGALATGGGQATVLVSHELYGKSTDRVGLTFVK